MSRDHTIIVYRNPVEKAFWEDGVMGGGLVPVLLGVAVFFFVFLTANKLLDRTKLRFTYGTNLALLLGAVGGLWAMFYFAS